MGLALEWSRLSTLRARADTTSRGQSNVPDKKESVIFYIYLRCTRGTILA